MNSRSTTADGATPAVLLLVFNRPEQTRQSVQALLRERPARLYVSGDGARPDVPTDAALIEEVWRIVHSAPWECEVKHQQAPSNLGCAPAVRAGLDWFFSQEHRGFVLEDDVVIGEGALRLAELLLGDGEANAQVGSITVFNTVPLPVLMDTNATYRQSLFSSSQGWGTWAANWHGSARSLAGWREWLTRERLRELGGRLFERRWSAIFDADLAEGAPVWDFTWQAHQWATAPYTLVPKVNLVENTGFAEGATFTAQRPKWWPMSMGAWDGSFRSPRYSSVDQRADHWEGRHRYGITPMSVLRAGIASRVPQFARAYRRARYGSVGR